MGDVSKRVKPEHNNSITTSQMNVLASALGALILLFIPYNIHAACSNPTANAGVIENFPASNTSKYCDGNSWVSMQYGGLTPIASLTDTDNIQTPGAVTVIGNYGYILDSSTLHVLNLTTPGAPVKIASLALSAAGTAITASGNNVYVAGASTLFVINVSSPAAPTISGQVTNSTYISSGASDIKVVGNYAYIVGSNTLGIVDVSNPATPTVTGYRTDATNMFGLKKVAISGNYAFVTVNAAKITALNISNPASPTFVSSLSDAVDFVDANGIVTSGNYAYVAYRSGSSANGGVTIVDISNPAAMSKVSVFTGSIQASLIEKRGNYLYVSQYLNGCAVYTLDVTNPTLPVTLRVDDKVPCYGLTAMSAGTSSTRMLGTADGVIYTFDISAQSLLSMNSSKTISDGDVTYFNDISISGNIAAVISGNHDLITIDVSNPLSMVPLAHFSARESYNLSSSSVVNTGSYAFMSLTNFSKLRLIDISTPSSPQFVADFYRTEYWNIEKMVKSGNYLYTIGGNGLNIIDITTPTAPVFKANFNSGLSSAKGLAVVGNYAYVSSGGNKTVLVIDISNPTTPSLVGSVVDATYLLNARDIAVSGNYAYVAADNYVTVINISTPSAPTIAANLNSTNIGSYAGNRLKISGNYLYVSTTWSGNKAAVIDISTPTTPNAVKWMTVTSSGIELSGNYWFHASSAGVVSYDITTPATPVLKHTVSWSGTLQSIGGVAASGNYIFVTSGGSKAVRVFDITNISNPTLVGSLVDATRLSSAGRFAFDGSYMYVLATNQLTIVNASTPTSPTIQGFLQDSTNLASPVSIAINGNYAYIAASGRFSVVNISNKSAPTFVAGLVNASLSQCKGIFYSANYVYLACNNFFAIIDVSNPSSPSLASSLTDSNYYSGGNGIAVYGNYAYYSASATYGGAIIDVTVKTNPIWVKGYNPYSSSAQSQGLYLNGSTLYWSDSINRYLQQIDLSVDPLGFELISKAFSSSPGGYPSNMTVAGSKFVGTAYSSIELWDTSPKTLAVIKARSNMQNKYSGVRVSDISGNKLYSINYGGVLSVIDVSTPTAPSLIGSFFHTALKNPQSLTTDGNYLYFTAEGGCSYCLGIVDVRNPSNIKLASTSSDFTNAYYATKSKIIGNNWYVATSGRVSIFNAANKYSVSLLGSFNTSTTVGGFDVVGSYVYLCGGGKFQALNVSTPSAISLAGELSDAGLNNCKQVTVNGNYALASSTDGDYLVIDISTPTSPTKTSGLRKYQALGFANAGIKTSGNLAFIGGSSAVSVIDNTTIASPTVIDAITTNSTNYTIANSGNNVFVMNTNFTVYNYIPITNLGACSQPGSLSYNSVQNVYSYCDGSFERPVANYPGSGGAGCASPTAINGSLKYDTTLNKYRFCDGTNWINITGRVSPLANCANNATGSESINLADGETFSCTCTASAVSAGTAYGTTIYSYDSSICRAARHAGKVGSTGGEVKYRMQAGQGSYTGSTQNSVTSSSKASSTRSFDFP